MHTRIAILTLLALGGCASGLSEQECEVGDWYRIGVQDGRDGQSSARLNDRIEQCGRFDLPVDPVLYEEGREAGVALFCTPQGALDAALRGVGNIGLCASSGVITQRAYSVGTDYRSARSDYRTAEHHYRDLINDIDRYEGRVRSAQAAARRAETEQERNRILREVADLRRYLGRARDGLTFRRNELRRAERRLNGAERELARLRQELAIAAADRPALATQELPSVKDDTDLADEEFPPLLDDE